MVMYNRNVNNVQSCKVPSHTFTGGSRKESPCVLRIVQDLALRQELSVIQATMEVAEPCRAH